MDTKQSKGVHVTDHASRKGANRVIVVGVVMLAFGGLLALAGVVWFTPLLLIAGPFWIALGIWQRRSGVGAQLCNTSSGAVESGRFADAEALLNEVEAMRLGKYFQRFVALQRATMAMRGGDLERVVALAEPALAFPVGRLNPSAATHRCGLFALRALASAGLGRPDSARSDIAAVRGEPWSTPNMAARAELAEAMVLERSGDRAALRAHLAAKRFVLLEHSTPRERALVRGYQQMLRQHTTTPYREPAPEPAHPAAEEPSLGDWVTRVAPGAARFVRDKAHPGARAPLPIPQLDPATQAAAKARLPAPKSAWKRVLVLWTLLIVMFIAVWQFFAPQPGAVPVPLPPPVIETPPGSDLAQSLIFSAALVAFMVVLVAVLILQNLRVQRIVAAVHGTVARGDLEAAMAQSRALLQKRSRVLAGSGAMWVSWLLDRDAAWVECLAVTETGIAKVRGTDAARVASADVLLPSLHAQRAVALQALGRPREGDVEVALLYAELAAFPGLPVTHHRCALIAAVRRGDFAEAVRLADTAGEDLSIPPREELLADLARAVSRPEITHAAEVERLRDELRDDPQWRRWVESLSPALLSRFDSSYSGAV